MLAITANNKHGWRWLHVHCVRLVAKQSKAKSQREHDEVVGRLICNEVFALQLYDTEQISLYIESSEFK